MLNIITKISKISHRRAMMSFATRVERDTFGDIEVPADKYWGA